MDELELGSEWRQCQQRHGRIGKWMTTVSTTSWKNWEVNDDSVNNVNIVMDELELELNDDSNKIEHWGSRDMSRNSKEPDEYN
jgi:hypothetical protein